MRVIAGEARGRTLTAPEGRTVRPTSDRVREAVFNVLYSLGGVEGSVVVDLFAGSGALGIEALSRGADHAVFVESDREALAAIETNLATLGLDDRAEVVARDVWSWLEQHTGTVDLVFADPPYEFDRWDELLAGLDAVRVVAESDRDVEAPTGWRLDRAKSYGATVVSILSRVEQPGQPVEGAP
ncbi:MAG: 16S rRNA (guanine(966)-N(2))-methyltransferase RsmD [Acidimicrobiia bacterium]|nr:16S rRNA (guanine(966)-N(2))-methyltransferase RsmD [Acidimicrobiia bacterium]